MSKVVTYILAGSSFVLCVVSFIVPPTGVIDPSVLAAVGEMFAFAALINGVYMFDKGADVKIRHGDTTIETTNEPDRVE